MHQSAFRTDVIAEHHEIQVGHSGLSGGCGLGLHMLPKAWSGWQIARRVVLLLGQKFVRAVAR
jgi:hypothetical protein